MEVSVLEFYRNKVAENPNETTVARFVHYALTALLREDIGVDQFHTLTLPYAEHLLLLDEPTGHINRTQFTLGSLLMECGPAMKPEVYLSGIGETNRQFSFRLDANGSPQYEIFAPNACI